RGGRIGCEGERRLSWPGANGYGGTQCVLERAKGGSSGSTSLALDDRASQGREMHSARSRAQSGDHHLSVLRPRGVVDASGVPLGVRTSDAPNVESLSRIANEAMNPAPTPRGWSPERWPRRTSLSKWRQTSTRVFGPQSPNHPSGPMVTPSSNRMWVSGIGSTGCGGNSHRVAMKRIKAMKTAHDVPLV